MERSSSAVYRKSPKNSRSAKGSKKKGKSQPIKVVYISNPMKVTTSAAMFRGLVQKLTGWDSNVADSMNSGTTQQHPTVVSPSSATAEDSPAAASVSSSERPPPPAYRFAGGEELVVLDGRANCGVGSYMYNGHAAALPFEGFDEAFGSPTPQMLEGYAGFMSSALY